MLRIQGEYPSLEGFDIESSDDGRLDDAADFEIWEDENLEEMGNTLQNMDEAIDNQSDCTTSSFEEIEDKNNYWEEDAKEEEAIKAYVDEIWDEPELIDLTTVPGIGILAQLIPAVFIVYISQVLHNKEIYRIQ